MCYSYSLLYDRHFTQVSLDVALSFICDSIVTLSHLTSNNMKALTFTKQQMSVQSLYLLANFHKKLSYSDDLHGKGLLQTKGLKEAPILDPRTRCQLFEKRIFYVYVFVDQLWTDFIKFLHKHSFIPF